MAKNDAGDREAEKAELNTKVERTELQARLFEAQVRVFEARQKLAALRKANKEKQK